jgi:hypothetical protein
VGTPTTTAVHYRVLDLAQYGKIEVATRCTKGGSKPEVGSRMPGAGLSRKHSGKAPPEGQPSSRTAENPPYGMIGGIEETSASFEARSAPRCYPTEGGGQHSSGPFDSPLRGERSTPASIRRLSNPVITHFTKRSGSLTPKRRINTQRAALLRFR